MVGTRFICALTGKLPREPGPAGPPGLIQALPQKMATETVWQEDRLRLSCVKHCAYPVTTLSSQEFLIYLEGRLYGLNDFQVQEELLRLARRTVLAGCPATCLTEWLRERDGDFLLFIFHQKTNTIWVINDLFARLPTYYYNDGRSFMLSRHLGYIREQAPQTSLDPMALAQHLAFGFPLGPRTLFQNIQALPPASLVTIDLQRSRARLEILHQHNLDHRQLTSPNTADNAALLAELFQDACHSRISAAGMNVVSLSGGLDSRAVAACLPQENRRVAAATFLDHEGGRAPDFQTARQVASHLHLPWYPFQLAPPRPQEVQTLLQLKQGANNLEMSFILAFFGGLLKTFGPDLTYFTGDGGGDTLGESRPYRQLASPTALRNYLIERYQVFPLKTAAALTRVPAGELLADLDDVLASYPEATPARKYQHFFCLEVAVKQYNHGEDRNRQYFWSVSPFYAPRFFTCAMSCPDRQKRGLRLYQKFLEILSPGLASIPYADWGAPLGSLKFTVLHAAKNLSRSHPEITRRIRRFLHSPHHEAQQFFPAQALKKQLVAVNGLADYFSGAALMGLSSKVDTLSMAQRWNLFTLTSLVGDLTRNHRTQLGPS